MRRMIAIFSFLIPLLVAFSVSALGGKITGVYEYDGDRIDSVSVDRYRIADYDGNPFNFRTGFEPVDIGVMTNSELGEYGQSLAQIAQSIEAPEASTQTNDGEYAFTEMEEGIYLVVFEDITIGDYIYSALPIVLTMPDANMSYNLSLTTKLEKSCPDCINPGPPAEDEDNSNTHDNIRFYIRLLIVLIIVETLTLFVIIKPRKREDSNE